MRAKALYQGTTSVVPKLHLSSIKAGFSPRKPPRILAAIDSVAAARLGS
jgi:hypothetical protein